MLAEIPEGPPARFTWRRVTRRVVKAEGPERIAPEWWLELSRSLECVRDFWFRVIHTLPAPPLWGSTFAHGANGGG